MRPKTHKFNNILYFVIANEKIIPFYMTLHIVLPPTLQGMRIVFIWNVLTIGKLCHDTIQSLHLFSILTETFEVFLELRGSADFFHHFKIDSIKLCTLSMQTASSLPFSASRMACNVTALGVSLFINTSSEAFSDIFKTFTPRKITSRWSVGLRHLRSLMNSAKDERCVNKSRFIRGSLKPHDALLW